MKVSVQINRGIETLFGTRDENIRLLESNLNVQTRLMNDSLEVEGEPESVERAEKILQEYVALLQEGHVFNNGDLNSYLRVVTGDAEATLRGLVSSGRQRNFGKKVLAPKTINQRRYMDAIERHDLVLGIGPAGTGKTYLAVAMAVSALLSKRVARIILTRPAVEAGERLGFLPGTLQEKVDPYLRPLYDALYDMLEAEKVEKFLERKLESIHIVGGGGQSDVWCQIFADGLNVEIRQVKDPIQANARGAAFIAAAGLGEITFADVPALVKIQRTYAHNGQNRGLYDERFCVFLGIYKQMRGIYRQLNTL